MKIVATSDLHGNLPEIPECDVLIIAGDVCPAHDHSHPFQRSWLETNFSEWLMKQPARLIIGIGGNHDFALERDRLLAVKVPWAYLLDDAVEFEGVKFYGMPWVPNLSLWAFHLDDVALDEKAAKIPQDTDVLIVHGPPLGYLDKTCPRYGSVNAGAPSFEHVLNTVRPALYICGHIHEGYGVTRHPSGTLVCNVSHVTENYEPLNSPLELQWLEKGSVAFQGRSSDGRTILD